MQIKLFKRLSYLYKDFHSKECCTSSEYIATKLNATKEEIYHFLKLTRHQYVLEKITDDFIRYNNIVMNTNKYRFQLLFYILINVLNCETIDDIKDIFVHSNKITYTKNTLEYFDLEENQILTAYTACKYFDNEYVLQNFIHPILNNLRYYDKIRVHVEQEENKLFDKKLTVPLDLEVTNRPRKTPAPPTNTPAEMSKFKSTKVPKTTYRPDPVLEKKLGKEYLKNKVRAQTLLMKAKSLTARVEPKAKAIPEIVEFSLPKPKRLGIKRDVPIKKNLATIMREASLLAKEKETCIKEIDNILQGGMDIRLSEAMEIEMRYMDEQKLLEEIERNRLKSLISHEEAAIAKKRVFASNQLKMIQFKEERAKLLVELEKWKDGEQKKMKNLIEKGQEIFKNAKESERQMIESKQNNARLIQWESKTLRRQAIEVQQEELNRKINLIQEIKALHQVRSMHVKEFDRYECPNLGLLCEMSIAELQERLYMTKVRLKQELDDKKQCIIKRREEKLQMVEDAKSFVEQTRMSKPKSMPSLPVKIEQTPELIKLRKRLEAAKNLRKKMDLCPCQPCPEFLK